MVGDWCDILLFALGLEFSFKKLVKVGGTAVIAACTIIFCMILVGILWGGLSGGNAWTVCIWEVCWPCPLRLLFTKLLMIWG